MRSALKEVSGVEDARVDFARRKATVRVRSGVTPARLCAAVKQAGFGCSPSRG